MALRYLRPIAMGIIIAGLSALFLAACGDDDGDPTTTPPPGTTEAPTKGPTEPVKSPTVTPGTLTPTPDANTDAGFRAALEQLNKELANGSLDAFIARLKVIDYTCKASDVTPGLGQPECDAVGEVIRGFQSSNWRSEGGLRKVASVIANLKERQAGFDTSKSDDYGSGALHIFAFDPTTHTAVVTVISKCLPEHQCPSGTERLVWVPTFEYVDGHWKISKLLYAYVLGEDFLSPSQEGKNLMPGWEKF
ncbi:MAG: hypothetical protein AB7N24_01085 [Dehalococcoidia bacterium]